MAIPETLAPKLDPLIRRLATNHDGEVIATVRALERVLVAAGANFHDLATCVTKGTRPPEVIIIRERPTPPPRQPDGELGHEDMIRALKGAVGLGLSEWESEFVAGCHRQLARGRPLSRKQQGSVFEGYAP